MPAHSMDSLFRSLARGELAPIYYLYGLEDVLKDDAVRAILDRALDPAMREFNLDQRSAGQVDPEEVHALCNTLPMMAERRVVVIREVEAWRRKTRPRSEFLRYLERPSPETVVVLVQGSAEEAEDKELARAAYTVRLDPLSTERAARWVLHRAGTLGVSLDAPAAEYLVQSMGSDLGALSSELAKLASLPADEPLTPERLGELIGVRYGETQWDWRAAVLEEQTGRAITLLAPVLAQPGMSGVKLVTLLGTTLIGLGITRRLYEKGLRARALEDAVYRALLKNRPGGLLGYKVEAARWIQLVPQWPPARVDAALRACLAADQALKSTTISDERGVLTDLVLQISLGEEAPRGGSSRNRIALAAGPRIASRTLAALSVLLAFSAFSTPQTAAQTDPRLIQVIRHAQEGESDSARIKVQRLLAATPPTDTLYPQIVYTQAMVASDASDMRRQLQRVAVEYSSSSWADDALLRLVQLDYASANLDAAARNLERIRLDYPGTPLLPQAAYWAARTYFDQKKPDLACRWIAEGLTGSSANVELQNQLSYLNQRCSQFAARPDTQQTVASAGAETPRPSTPAADTARLPSVPPAQTPPEPATVPPADSVSGANPAPPLHYRIQITAVRNVATAQSVASKLKSRGFNPITVEEGGLYKVRIGDYATKAEAVAAVPEIKAKLGGSPFVVAGS